MVRIACDVEGVLARIQPVFVEEFNDYFGTGFTVEDVSEWGFGELRAYFEAETGYGMDEFFSGVPEQDPDDPPEAPVREGFDGFTAVMEANWRYGRDRIKPTSERLPQYLEQVKKAVAVRCGEDVEDVELDIVTARHGVDREIIDWLAYHGVESGEDGVYDRFVTADDKADLGYDVYLDDNPEMVDDLDDDQVQMLIDNYWNRGVAVAEYGNVEQCKLRQAATELTRTL